MDGGRERVTGEGKGREGKGAAPPAADKDGKQT